MSSALLALLSLALQGYEVRCEAPDVEPRARGNIPINQTINNGMVETNLETPNSNLCSPGLLKPSWLNLDFAL